jgi:hypothetical protein
MPDCSLPLRAEEARLVVWVPSCHVLRGLRVRADLAREVETVIDVVVVVLYAYEVVWSSSILLFGR